MGEFACPDKKRTITGHCGQFGQIHEETSGDCHHCCYLCNHARDMTCSVVCGFVAERYHVRGEEQVKEVEPS